MFLRKALILICGFSLVALAGVAQTGSSAPGTVAKAPQAAATSGTRVHGTITDPDGELIPGASVTFTPAKGGAVKVVSGSDGTYSINVAPGAYTLLVTMPGFAAYSAVNLKIPAVPSTTVDASLKIGEQTQVVNVDATTVQVSVDADSNASSLVITGKDLEALSDDPDELASELTALAGPSAGPNGGQIYVDGFTGGQLPPKSSIREIRVNQNPFSAEYDKLGYGRVEVFTKPGTDKIHGSFQMNGNPSQFNTGSPLEAGTYQPPYHTLFMFGSLTGPLTSKTSYSIGGSHRDIEEDQYTNATVLAPGVTPATNCSVVTCTQQYQASTYFPQIRTDINPRIDLALGDKNVLTMRYQFVDNDSTDDGPGGLNLPSYEYNSSSLSNIVQMSDTQNFNSKLINETRFEYEREHTAQTVANGAPTISVSGAFTSGGYSGQNQTDHQDHWEVQNYTSVQLKKNFLRMGGRLRINREAQDSRSNTNGTFTYSGLLNTASSTGYTYQSGNPSQFTYTQINVPNVEYSLADLGLYAETDWKPMSNLTVSYGIRFETQNHLNDHADFAPRLSFAYGIGGAKTAPKTVIRGGYGMFYDRFGQGQVLTLAREGINTNILTAYTVTDPVGCTPSTFAACVAAAKAGGTTTSTTYQAAPNLRTPYVTQFAIGTDQQLGRFGTMSVNYLRTQGVHQLATQNIGYPTVAPVITPTTTFPSEYQYFSEGAFNQNQLIVNGRVQTTRWLSIFGYYAMNSAHGDSNGAGSFISTPYDIQADYGRTGFSVRNRLFLAGSVNMPHFVQFSPFMIAQSGNPYNVTEGVDINHDNLYNDRPLLVPTGTPGSVSISGCGTFLSRASGLPAPAGSGLVPVNYCTGPALFTLNFRLTKTIGFGPSNAPKPTAGQGGQGAPGTPGQHQHGAGGGRGGGQGGPGGGGPFGGGGSNTGKRYNLAFGLQVQNLFNNEDLANPQGTLTSPEFGQSTQLAGGPYTTSNALRRISLQASFNF